MRIYGQDGQVSKVQQEFDKLRGDLDILGVHYDSENLFVVNGRTVSSFSSHIPEAAREKVARLMQLRKEATFEDRGPKATSYYNQISPFDTKKFPVVRVDVVLPEGLRKSYEDALKEWGLPDTPGNRSHYERSVKAGTETNKPLWQQDNLHENLPNTLGWAMLQYKTGPNGEKIAVIAEAQSRWGQKMREQLKKEEDKTLVENKVIVSNKHY